MKTLSVILVSLLSSSAFAVSPEACVSTIRQAFQKHLQVSGPEDFATFKGKCDLRVSFYNNAAKIVLDGNVPLERSVIINVGPESDWSKTTVSKCSLKNNVLEVSARSKFKTGWRGSSNDKFKIVLNDEGIASASASSKSGLSFWGEKHDDKANCGSLVR